ncbi:hypothetical protein [Streptomyces sp. NPDC006645]|uniref:hypothetical protein n=1 Tax=unclassified Streptomyces TaxID=2593676 RepID=UPI0033A461A7
MPGENEGNFASNNPYGAEYQRQWSREAPTGQPAGQTPAGQTAAIDPAYAQQLMAAEARRYWARTGQPPMDSEEPGPAQQESTLPAYRTQASTWEQPSQTWENAADEDGRNQLREWNRQQGLGTPTEENLNQWDYETMTPEQAAAAAAAAETWRHQTAPVQPPAYPQSYQDDQSQGYTAGMTLSPEQAAYGSRRMAGTAEQRAYEQSQALSAVQFPGGSFQESDFQGRFRTQHPPNDAETYTGTPPRNSVAGPANASLAALDSNAARAQRRGNDDAPRQLGRSGAVRHSTRRQGPRGGPARGGGG